MTTTANPTIDLQRFCGESSLGRYLFQRPFVQTGKRYASDGRICVRVPAMHEPDTIDEAGQRFPDAADLFKDFPAFGFWHPWPDVPALSTNRLCEACGDDEEPRQTPCPVCKGIGTAVQPLCIFVGETSIGAKYHELIRSLPNAVYFAEHNDPRRGLPFKFDGGQGIVMPRVGDKHLRGAWEEHLRLVREQQPR